MKPTEAEGGALQEYGAAIATVARSAAPVARRSDVIGYTRDDYAQELALVAAQARQRFRDDHGFSTTQERRYVLKSLWNHVRDRMKTRGRVAGLHAHNRAATLIESVVRGPINPFPQYDAREYARRLERDLGSTDVALVRRLAEAGGHVPRAHDPQVDGSLRTFRRTVDRLRQRAEDLRP